MKNFISSGKRQGRSFAFPITPFFATAAMMEVIILRDQFRKGKSSGSSNRSHNGNSKRAFQNRLTGEFAFHAPKNVKAAKSHNDRRLSSFGNRICYKLRIQ